MDALDKLIQLANLTGALDLRCLLSGPLELDHAPAPPGEAVYHVVLDGACTVLRQGHAPLELNAGDIFFLPRGDAHVLSIEARERNTAKAQVDKHHNGAVTIESNCGGRRPGVDLLCGRFLYAPRALLVDVLPDVVHVSFSRTSAPYLEPLVQTMRREAEEAQLGAPSIVTALSTAFFTMVLRAWLAEQPSLAGVLGLLVEPAAGRVHHRDAGTARRAVDARDAREGSGDVVHHVHARVFRAFGQLAAGAPESRAHTAREHDAHADDEEHRGCRGGRGHQSEAAFSKRFKELYGVAPGKFRRANGLE